MSAVFRVVENGAGQCFQTEHNLELLDAARLLRDYLQRWSALNTHTFSEMFPAWEQISTEEFHRQAALRMENTGEVAGAFDLDFDKREFAAVHIMDGWLVFPMGDVCAAADSAFREEGVGREEQWSRLLDGLDGKVITSAGHLSAQNVSFAEEIIEVNGLLNFYLRTDFDVDAVFGTYVCTAENDDWLNAYVNYDMAAGEVCDELEVDLHREGGSEEAVPYTLNAAEKEVLRWKMDEYCQRQTGQTLKEYSTQLLAEAQEVEPPDGPVM